MYDGHGGVDAANFCAENLHQILCKTRSFHEGNIEKALIETFNETDRLFCTSLLKTQSGCTAIVCLREIVEDPKQVKLYFAWVGDSQAVLVRDGTAIDVTPPHKPDDDKEINRIESLGGIVVKSDCYRVNGLLAVSRAIGDASYKPYITADPEVRVETLKGSEDFMILACDGLWDQVDCDDATQMVYETIQDSNDPVEAAKSVAACLVESAKNQGSADNITVIVVFLRSLRDILPTTSFNDVPKVEKSNKQKEAGEMLFGLEPVQLRARKDLGNIVPQGNGEDVEGLKVRIAGDSTMNAFKNGIVSSLTPLRGEDPQIIKLPSPTLQSCLADSTMVTETMNSESTTTSSIPSSRCEEEAIPHPLIKSVTAVDSTCPITTSASSSSCLVTPPNVSGNDLLQFSFAPHAGEERQQTIETSEQIQVTNPEETILEMETNHVRDAFSPSFKTESKNEEIRIEEEFEETTVTTEAVFDPVPMSRTTEKIFTAPSSVTNLLHEFSNESRANGRPPSPIKLRESYSISSPSGNEKVIRVSSGDSSKDSESLSKKDVFSTNSHEVLEQVKETKVFEVDTVINKSPIPGSLVRVHQVQIEQDSTPQASARKEVDHSSMNGSGMTKGILVESSVVTSSSEIASSSFQASSNGFNRAFLECDSSSQNLSKDEELRMKDFSPYDNGKMNNDYGKEHSNMNNDYLTLSTSVKGGISPETQVRKVPHDMEAISESIKKLTTTATKELPNDLKPLSPSSTGKSPQKRATSPTASSRAKEVAKAKVGSTAGARSKPLATAATKPQVVAKPWAVKITVSKPSTMTRATIAKTAAGTMSNAAKPSVAAKTTADRTTARSAVTAPPKSSLLTTRPATGSVRPVSRTSAPRVASAAVKNQVEPRKPVSAVSLLSTKVKPTLSTTARAPLTRPAPTVASKPSASAKSSSLPRSSASTSALKPVASKVDSGLSSLKTVRLNVSTTSGLRSSSTSGLRTVPSLKPAIKKVAVSKPATQVSPTKTATQVSPTKTATRVSPTKTATRVSPTKTATQVSPTKTATVKNSVPETKEPKSNGTKL